MTARPLLGVLLAGALPLAPVEAHAEGSGFVPGPGFSISLPIAIPFGVFAGPLAIVLVIAALLSRRRARRRILARSALGLSLVGLALFGHLTYCEPGWIGDSLSLLALPFVAAILIASFIEWRRSARAAAPRPVQRRAERSKDRRRPRRGAGSQA